VGLGLGIILIVIGAILSFAVKGDFEGVDLVTIGYILMGAGVLTLILGMVMNNQRANTSHREVVDRKDTVERRNRNIDE